MAKRHSFQTEIDFAAVICAHLGCELTLSNHDYEIATVKRAGVQLLIYPHKTSGTNNISARVRDNGSKNKAEARRIMIAMKNGEGLPEETRWKVATFNTFSAKKLPGSTRIGTT